MTPPRLLFSVNVDWFFVSHRLPLAVAAAAAGWDVHVCGADTGATEQVTAAGIPFHPVPLDRHGLDPRSDVRALAALAGLYRRLRPDVIHHVALKPVVYGSLAATVVPRAGVVNALSGLGWTFSDDPRAARARLVATSLLRLGLRRPHSITILQNPETVAEFVRHRIAPAGRIVLLRGSGVDLAEFMSVAEPVGPPSVLFASRMLADKGVGDFVEMARLLDARGADARFLLAGSPDDRNPASLTVADLEAIQATAPVTWLGQRDDMAKVLGDASIVVLPSLHEGLPRILLEAAACGRPIVATDIPGNREICVPGRTGALVPIRSPEALADAVERLLADPAERARMGAEARALAESEFSLDSVVSRTLALYEDLLPASAASGDLARVSASNRRRFARRGDAGELDVHRGGGTQRAASRAVETPQTLPDAALAVVRSVFEPTPVGSRRGRGLHTVVLMIGQLGRGGTERQLYLLAKGLMDHGIEVAVVTLFEGGPYQPMLEDHGIVVHSAGLPRLRTDGLCALALLARRILALTRWFRKVRPDVVHSYLFHAYALAPLVTWPARVPAMVAGRRSLGYYKERIPMRAAIEVAVNLATDAIVANSHAVAADTREREHFVSSKIRVIPNGIEPEMFEPRVAADAGIGGCSGAPVILCVASLIHYKGHTILLDAAELLDARGVKLVLVLAGDGPERKKLEAQANALSVDVRFLGDRDDVAALLATADVVVQASVEEGMPNAVMEAMAAGKAIVATAVGGTADVLGDAGVLVPPRDPAALADGIEAVLTDAEERNRLGRAAIRRARAFTVDRMVERHIGVYEELLG